MTIADIVASREASNCLFERLMASPNKVTNCLIILMRLVSEVFEQWGDKLLFNERFAFVLKIQSRQGLKDQLVFSMRHQPPRLTFETSIKLTRFGREPKCETLAPAVMTA